MAGGPGHRVLSDPRTLAHGFGQPNPVLVEQRGFVRRRARSLVRVAVQVAATDDVRVLACRGPGRFLALAGAAPGARSVG